MVLSGTVKPAETIRLKMPVKVPTGSWGRHRLPVVVEVAWEGEKLEASFVANLGAAYITEWMVLGPFSRTDKESPEASPGSGLSRVEMDKPTRRFAGLDPAVHPPETRLDLKAEYDGVHGKIRWLPLSRTQYSPNLGPLLGNPQMGTAYALAAVRASEETLARLWLTNLIGDAGQVWVNGKELRELRGTLGWGTSSTIRLRQGDNIILVKVTTRKGNWSLGLAVEDGNPEAGGRLQLVPAKELPGIRSDQIAEKEG
jgi:hypothetical protein